MPTDIVFQIVLFRLLFKLSLRDLMHRFLIRGYEFSYETVRDWEARFSSLLADQVRRRRKDKKGRRHCSIYVQSDNDKFIDGESASMYPMDVR
jgi:transposase-like protein